MAMALNLDDLTEKGLAVVYNLRIKLSHLKLLTD